jgi:hypothetical protein
MVVSESADGLIIIQLICVKEVFIYAELFCREIGHDRILLTVMFSWNYFCVPEERNSIIHFLCQQECFFFTLPGYVRVLFALSLRSSDIPSAHTCWSVRWWMFWTENTIPSEAGGKWIELNALFYLRRDLQLSSLIFCRDIPFLLSPDIRRAFSVSFSSIFSLYVSRKNERNGALGCWVS